MPPLLKPDLGHNKRISGKKKIILKSKMWVLASGTPGRPRSWSIQKLAVTPGFVHGCLIDPTSFHGHPDQRPWQARERTKQRPQLQLPRTRRFSNTKEQAQGSLTSHSPSAMPWAQRVSWPQEVSYYLKQDYFRRKHSVFQTELWKATIQIKPPWCVIT